MVDLSKPCVPHSMVTSGFLLGTEVFPLTRIIFGDKSNVQENVYPFPFTSAVQMLNMVAKESTRNVFIEGILLPTRLLGMQDLSPKYAGALLGISNTAGAIPGVLGITSVGFLLDRTNSWGPSLFYPIIFCQLFGLAIYTLFASSEPTDW